MIEEFDGSFLIRAFLIRAFLIERKCGTCNKKDNKGIERVKKI